VNTGSGLEVRNKKDENETGKWKMGIMKSKVKKHWLLRMTTCFAKVKSQNIFWRRELLDKMKRLFEF